MAVLSGLDPRAVGDLDEDEFMSLMRAVQKRQRFDSWTNLHESVAALCEAMWAVLARLEAGIAVVQVREIKKPKDFGRYPRPSWLEVASDPKEIVVTSVAEGMRMLKGGVPRGD